MLKSIGYKSALISITISLFGLLSYIPGMDLLGRVRYEYIPMAPSTGISFLILGIGLIILYMKEISKEISILILIASIGVSLFGILEVIGYFVDMDLNYEDSIVPIMGNLNGVPIARMSPATGAVFFISGVSIIFVTLQKFSLKQNTINKLFVNLFGHLSLIVSFAFCLSYLYGTPFLYETNHTIPMALTTALSFLFLSIAIIFIDENSFIANFSKETSTRNYLFKFIFPISTLSVIVSGLATVFTIQSSVINPALISASITIFIMIFVGLLSNYLSRHMGISIDNIERENKKITLALKESENKFRAIFEQAAVGVARVNLDGRWLEVNKKLCDIVGYPQEELLTKTFQDITHPDDLQSDLDYINQLLNDEIKTYSMEKRYFKKNGDIIWINLTVTLVRQTNDDPDYFIAIIEDITKQKKDQERLRESEEKFRAIFEQSRAYCLILDPNTSDGIPIIVDANAAACKNHGYSREDFIGRPVADIDDEAGKILVKKRTAEIMTGKPFFVENIHVRKDGTSFPVAVYANRLDIGDKTPLIFSTEYDISELKQAENELKLSNDKFEKAFNYTPTIIVISNIETSEIYDVNKTFLNKFEYEKDEVIGKTSFDIGLWSETKDRKRYLDSFNRNGFIEGDIYVLKTKNNKLIAVKVYANIVTINNQECILSVAEDITELKHKDEMLINQSRQAAMGEMIGMIAHQWRQPISAIAMAANNMLLDIELEDFNTVEAEGYAKSIAQQTQHLSKTIDDFRNFFKPDKDILEVSIKETIDNTLSIVKDSLKNNSIELRTSFETDKKVKAYPRELMQVFVNIITNSKDVLISHQRENSLINIRVYEDEKYINTEICDNGGGIDDDVLPKVFEPYFSTKDEKSGTGLGLYMSKMIIEKHLNGTIEVYNNDDGACFTVRLLKKQIEKE